MSRAAILRRFLLPASRRLRTTAVVLALLLAAPWTALAVVALFVDTPALPRPPGVDGTADGEPGAARTTSVRVLDREGGVLAELRDGEDQEARWVALADAPRVAAALVAAEDRRFRGHLGVDPLRTARAAWDGLAAGRVVSGASTITQQLARIATGAPRTPAAKVEVVATALRLELAHSKDEILEQYLNRAPFGARIRGVEAASRRFFDKPAAALSLGEAATLAAIPQSPARLDPRREAGRARLLRRRDEILGRIESSGLAPADEVARARSEPLALAPRFLGVDAPHFVRAVAAGRADPCAAPQPLAVDGVVAIETTLDPALQAAAVEATRRAVAEVEDRHVTSAAAIVLDNSSGEILAWVGSPGLVDSHLGHNDGVLALRQPGSALKPFVYELAIERLGFSPATLLPDVELSFPARDGVYRPQNYDGTFHGPVLLREALGNSFNVPAVWTTQRLGAGPVVRRLRDLGMCSITGPAERYGLAVALGDAEITLVELATAYMTLARGGEAIRPRAVRRVLGWDGARWDGAARDTSPTSPRQVLDPAASRLILDVLSDPGARVASFGERSVLSLPFAFAAKTGTSKGFRDNVAVGATPDVTIAVWVGNMDGSPMRDVSGITGAGPLLRAIALAAARGEDRTFADAQGLTEVEVCPVSGARRGAHCPHGRHERMREEDATSATCEVHVEVALDAMGARADASCATTHQVVEAWPRPFDAWARSVGRPTPPREISAHCPPRDATRSAADREAPRIVFPVDGDRFHLDPGATAAPAIEIAVRGETARVELDGSPLPLRDGRARWVLHPGEHRLAIYQATRKEEVGGGSAPAHEVTFSVE